MNQSMIDFVFIAPPEDNQKFLGYVERVKHAQNCTESYKIRFDYSAFYVHIHVLKTADKRNLLGVYAESDTKIIIRNKKTNDEFVTVIRFEELCFYDSLDLLVNKILEFIKKHPVKHSEDFYTGLKNDH